MFLFLLLWVMKSLGRLLKVKLKVRSICDIVFLKMKLEWKEGDRIVSLHGAPCGSCDLCCSGNSPRCTVNAPYTYGLLCNGGYQQYAVLHANSLVKLPNSIPFTAGSFLCCTAAVSLRALKLGNVKPGNIVLITGASGGVGVHAIQVASALGARVVCITSNESKIPKLLELGASKVILSQENSFHRQSSLFSSSLTLPLTDNVVVSELGEPVDVVLELVGGPTFRSSFLSVKPTGTIVVVGNISVAKVPLPLGRMILFEIKVVGSSGATKEDVEEVIEMVQRGTLQPILCKEFPLSVHGIHEAHAMLKRKSVMGRLVINSSL